MRRALLLLALLLASCDRPAQDPLAYAQHRVNARMTYVQEAGEVDYWKVGRRSGDCEDYALAKRELLIAGGHDPQDLEVLLIKMGSGNGHATLYVRSRGLVLDNNEDRPVRLADFLIANRARVVCVARDLSEGSIYPVTRRC